MAATDTIWVLSNRVDDRVVLWEQDDRHPGGEAFVGGAGPDQVFKTPVVERMLRDGLMIEIPEPPDGPKKPISVASNYSAAPLNGPGQPVQLGRTVDGDLVAGAAEQKQIAKAQDSAPSEIAVPTGVIVPPAETAKS